MKLLTTETPEPPAQAPAPTANIVIEREDAPPPAPRPEPPKPDTLISPFFDRIENRRVENLPFAEYQAIPAINASLLRQPTSYEQLHYLCSMAQLDPEAQWLVEARGADVAEAMGMVQELEPRTEPRLFLAKVSDPRAGIKITDAQRKLLDTLDASSGPVDGKEFKPATVNVCMTNGWVKGVHREVPVEAVSESVKASRAMALCIGDASHKAILEPHMFDAAEWHKHWQLCPTESLVSKAALEVLKADPTRRLITSAIVDTARRVRDAVYKHKRIHNSEGTGLLDIPGSSELTVEAWDEELGVRRKIRLDRLPNDRNAPIVDIKTTHEKLLTPTFRSAVRKNGYHIQDAFYTDTLALLEGERRPGFMIIAVTKEAPFMARVFELNQALPEQSFYEEGKSIYEERAAAFVLAWHEKRWEAYENEDAQLLTTASY